LEEFFSTGEAEVSSVLARCRELGMSLKYGRGLDFGCGVGRLTRAFASRFSKCIGIDVSSEMVSQALEFNSQLSNCEFLVNHSGALPFIVLQHISTEKEILNWIVEFIRVLSPGGVLVFQLPDELSMRRRIQGRRRLWSLLQFLGLREGFLYQSLGLTPIRMTGVSSDRVQRVMKQAGAEIIRVEPDTKAGADYRSFTYFGRKKE
jgi:SAM-dependent methyltransferase